MHFSRALAVVLLPLAGCVVAPEQVGYGYGYQTAPEPVAAYVPEPEVYPGYNYNQGTPTIVVEGAAVPLVYYSGSWGYYNQRRQWRRAPEPVWRHLEQRYPAGAGFHHGQVRPQRPPNARPAGYQWQQAPPRQNWQAPRANPPQRNDSRDRHDYSPRSDRYGQ